MMCRAGYVSIVVGSHFNRTSLLLGALQTVRRTHTTSHNPKEEEKERVEDDAASPASSVPLTNSQVPTKDTNVPVKQKKEMQTDVEPVRWVQTASDDPVTERILDDKGQYIVSRVQWPTGEIAYTTPPPPDGVMAPRFGYNVVQVKKTVSWWKHFQKYPRFSVAYINIHVLFLLGTAWLAAFLTDEYRRVTDEMRTPGAMVGEHRGRGPVGRQSQKVAFTTDEMSEIVGRAQNNWMDAKTEANYIGSKNYHMKKIPRPKEFTVDDVRKR